MHRLYFEESYDYALYIRVHSSFDYIVAMLLLYS